MIFEKMRYLGIDYGRKRIGLALGEEGLVRPLVVYFQGKDIFEKISKICIEEAIDKVVLGISDNLEEEIKKFSRRLADKLNLPIVFQNEALTTREAIDIMLISSTKQKDRRKKVDSVAAAQILSVYFANIGDN